MPEAIRSWMERAGRGRSLIILGTGATAIVAILWLARIAAAPTYAPLLPGLPLEEVAAVTAKLEEEGISYRLEKGGTEVQVAESELAKARVALARDGLPSRGSPGFELFDRPAWGMTDFTQRINYRRALEGELERTISEMRGVEAARVHIALNESSGFRRASRPEAASIVLTTRNGVRPPGELVEAVASLVASSVDGLDSDRITVLDAGGHLLTAAVEAGSPAGLTKRQLQYRREVEQYLEAKAEALVAQAVGAGNARVSVAADLNFDRIDRTTQTVDPDQQVTVQEERSQIVPSEGQTGAASSAEASVFEASRSVETFSGAAGTVRRLSVAILVNDASDANGAIVPRSTEELNRIEALVANAIGLDRERGDQITTQSAPFSVVEAPPAPVEEGPSVLMMVPRYRNEIMTGLGLLLAFVLGLQLLRTLRASLPATKPAPLLTGGSAGAVRLEREGQGLTVPSAQTEMLERSVENPEMAVKVLRAWMKDA